MLKTYLHNYFIFSPLDSSGFGSYGRSHWHLSSSAELVAYIEELKRANEEINASRRAALNVMEDAILSKEELRKSEEKYRTLFESIDEGFSLLEIIIDDVGKPVDLLHLEANEAYKKITGPHVIGRRVLEIIPGIEQQWINFFGNVAITGIPNRAEYHVNAIGKWYTVYASRVGGQGSLRVVAVFNDITERKNREEQQKLLLTLSDAIRSKQDATAIEETVTQITMDFLSSDRCYYCSVEDDVVTINRDASKGNVPSVAGTYHLNDFRIFKKIVDEGNAFVVTDVNTSDILDASLKELCCALQIASFINVPVIKNGKPLGILCIVQSQPRNWKATEVETATEVAERIWSAVERAKAEEALRNAEKEHTRELEKKVNERTRELSASKELFQATMDASLDMIQVFEAVRNEKGEIIDFRWRLNNHTAEKYYGNVIGESLLKLNPGVIEAGIFDTFKQVVETGIPDQRERHYVYEQFDGWFYQSVVKLGDGVATTTTDITQRKKAEEEIQKQSRYIERITQTVPGMISVMDLDTGIVEYINTKVFYAHGFDPERMKKTSRADLRKVIHPNDHQKLNEYYTAFQSVIDSEAVTVDYRALTDAGDWHWYRARGKVFQRNEAGKVTHIVNNVENITKEKEAEEKIKQLNHTLLSKNKELESANAEIKTFNTIAATDYKETLQQLYTNLEFIITHEAKKLTDTGRANVRRAQSAIQKMKLLTDDIVSFMEIPSLDNILTEVNLNDIYTSVVSDLQEKIAEADAVLEKHALPTVKGYPMLLSLLFYHLLDNAIKFKKEDSPGFVWVTYKLVKRTDNAAQETTYHKISFADNGIGFNQQESDRLFQIFYKPYQKKYKGSGVGLAICKKIMDVHNGFITAEGVENNGSNFTCFFPA